MKKLNRNQKSSRRAGFASMSPRGQKRKPNPRNPFKNLFPIAEPQPIWQIHKHRGELDQKGNPEGRAIVAATVIPIGEPDPITGKYRKNPETGRIETKLVPVCRHRCTFINSRHTAFNKPRPRDVRRAQLSA